MDRLLRELQAFSTQHAVPETAAQDIHLALDEIVSNVVFHGCGGNRGCRITVDLELHGDRMEAHVRDDADAFDPLQRQDPEVGVPLSDRPIGGLGIYLVKTLMTEVHYHREDGVNHLALIKRWPDAPAL